MVKRKDTAGPSHELNEKIRILLVDDHPIVRKGLAQLIAAEPDLEVCGEAAKVNEALKIYEAEKPNLVIIDISLEDSSGIDLMERIRDRSGSTMMLALSMYDEGLYAERALRAGATAYVRKNNASEVLIDAIREVLAGRIYLNTETKDQLLQRIASGDKAKLESPVQTLSNRELKVFEQIGQGLTTGQIAREMHLSVKTIDTYRENIKKKLHLKNSAELGRHAVCWFLENT